MSWVMFRRALKDLRWTVFWYTLGVFLYGMMILSFYPTVRDNAAMMEQYIKVLPKALMEAFGVTDMASLSGFIGGEYLNLMWPLIASVFLIMTGTATVAREVERGTIELLLSVPESRTKLLAGKLAALLAGILALVSVTIGALALGAALVEEPLKLENLLALGAVLASFAVVVGGYSVLFSSFSKERGKAAGMAAGLTLAFYLAWVVASLSEDWEWLRNVSIFTAYEPRLGSILLKASWLLKRRLQSRERERSRTIYEMEMPAMRVLESSIFWRVEMIEVADILNALRARKGSHLVKLY